MSVRSADLESGWDQGIIAGAGRVGGRRDAPAIGPRGRVTLFPDGGGYVILPCIRKIATFGPPLSEPDTAIRLHPSLPHKDRIMMRPWSFLTAAVLAASLGLPMAVFGRQSPDSEGPGPAPGSEANPTPPSAPVTGQQPPETPTNQPDGTTPPPDGAPADDSQPPTDSSEQPPTEGLGPVTGPGADQPGNFSNARNAVVSFLNALKAKNIDNLADAVALHAPTEARPENQKLFQSILDASISDEMLSTIAADFDGYRIVRIDKPTTTGTFEVFIAKAIPAPPGVVGGTKVVGLRLLRVVTVRREQAGWKVQDISRARQSFLRRR
jgi:hypothetical protein